MSEYGAIGVCHVTKKHGLQSVEIEENSVAQIINFIGHLPNGWQHEGRDGSSRLIENAPPRDGKPARFRHMMRIYHPNCRVQFQAYFDADMRYLSLFSHVEQVRGYCMKFEGIEFEWKKKGQTLEIRMPRNDNPHHDGDHPLVELCHRALGAQTMHIIRPSTCRLFPSVLVDRWRRLELTRAAHQGLKRKLEELCAGRTKFYFREAAKHFDLIPLARGQKDPQKLFGLTWIFPWAASIIKHLRPSCLILDGTFESMKPYTLEVIEAVIANEAIPIGLGITPSESELSYTRLWDHLAETLGTDGADILKRIPLLSDQGLALKSLAKDRGLTWFLCHRHLIENAGASSIGGDWMRRLLAAGDLSEAQQVAAAIRAEMSAIGLDRTVHLFRRATSHGFLMTMLFAVEHNQEGLLTLWARWKRLGCPTTTNAGESIHAQLNLATRFARSFYSRLSAVKEYLWVRFLDRNSKERRDRRSVNKWCSDKMRAKVTAANWTFYMWLHSFDQGDGTRKFCGFSWGYPDVEWDPRCTVDWERETLDPPDGWIQDVPFEEVEGDPESTDTRGRSAGQGRAGSAAYLRTGWQIYRTAKLISGRRKNDRRGIEAAVFTIGERLREQNSISPQDELEWRMEVYTRLDLLKPQRVSK